MVSLLVLTQSALVFAAPSLDEAGFVSGTIDSISLVTNAYTVVTTVEITLTNGQGQQTVRVSDQTGGIPARWILRHLRPVRRIRRYLAQDA